MNTIHKIDVDMMKIWGLRRGFAYKESAELINFRQTPY